MKILWKVKKSNKNKMLANINIIQQTPRWIMTTDSFEYTLANKYYYLFCLILCVPSLNHVIIEMRKKWSLICVSSQSHASMKIAILKKTSIHIMYAFIHMSTSLPMHTLAIHSQKKKRVKTTVFFFVSNRYIYVYMLNLLIFIHRENFF